MKYRNYNLTFLKNTYVNNNTLYICAYCEEGPFCDITVNLPEGQAHDNYQYISVNNIPADLIQQMVRNKYITFTGQTSHSGFVDFPLYKFNKSWVNKLKTLK